MTPDRSNAPIWGFHKPIGEQEIVIELRRTVGLMTLRLNGGSFL